MGIGFTDIGIVGYSHGGGMIYNISRLLFLNNPNPMSASVVVAETIDAVAYGSGPDSTGTISPIDGFYVHQPLQNSPALIWQTKGYNSFGYNYWEPTGFAGGMGPGGNIRGMNEVGAINRSPFNFLNHSNIAVNAQVLGSVEDDIAFVFSELSY